MSAILLGPQGETRDWLVSLLAARPEIRLLGAHADPEHASNALKSSSGRKETAVLIDATLRDPNEARSVIRMMRERFPTVRVVVYGNELDEIAIEELYFLGADDVLLPQMREVEDTVAILNTVRKPVEAAVATIPEPLIEIPPDAARRDAGLRQIEEPAPAVEEPAGAEEEPAPTIEEPAPALEEPAPVVEAPAPAEMDTGRELEEPAPVIEEPAEAEEEPIRAVWRSRIQAIWKSPGPAIEEQAPAMGESKPVEESQAPEEPALEEPAPVIEEPQATEEPAPAVEAAAPAIESTPVSEERARPKEEARQAKASPRPRRPLMRRLAVLLSQRRRHAGWIPNRAKPDKVRFEDDQVARNLERLVSPWQSPEEEGRKGDGQEGAGGPDDS